MDEKTAIPDPIYEHDFELDFELFIPFEELVQYPTLEKELLDRLLFSATVWAALNSVEDYTTQTYSEYHIDFNTTQLVVRIIW